MDYETLAAEGEPGRSHLEDGTRVTAETARRLTCDASVVGVIEARGESVGDEASASGDGSTSGNGSAPSDTLAQGAGAARPTARILDIGRKTRTIPPALRRALYLRDGGCRFPGCGVRFTEGHHVEHWALGGRTELANLISLCRFHHRAVHEEGFEVRRTRNGDFRFFDRTGWPLPQRPRSTGVSWIVESRFAGTQEAAAKEAGRAPEGAEKADGGSESLQTLEETNRELGIDPQWHTAAARFSGSVDDPRNGEFRDLMFRAMDGLDPVEDGLDRTEEEAFTPGEENPGPEGETLGRSEKHDSPDGR